MIRLSWILPVRDGISTLNGQLDAGLRFAIDDNPTPPPNTDGHLLPLMQKLTTQGDPIHACIAFRFPNVGEGSGGSAPHYFPGFSIPYAVIVWGAPLANVFAQEFSHGLGLESPQSPHLDPKFDPAHSKDVTIDPTDAELGFNTQFNAPWPVPTYDVMYPTGPDPEYPDPSHSFNSWDWEFLRSQFIKLNSTGP